MSSELKSLTHTAPLFTKLKILDIFQINTLNIAKFMFCYHNNLLPPLFLNLFMTNSQVHKYDTRTAGNYRVHPCRTNIKKLTILYQGPKVWNCLPASITNEPMKMFRLGHETMNVCQRSVARFGHVECMFDKKLTTFFRVLEAWCHCDFRKMTR